MEKTKQSSLLSNLKLIKPWYIFVLLVICLSTSIYALRQNNLDMVKLRTAVYTADKNNTDVNGALKTLQAYVTSHMNSNLSSGPNAPYPPIQLEYTYTRLQQSNNVSASNVNQNLYTDAENYCQASIPTGFSGRYRVSCIEQYITNHGASVTLINPSLYEFNFLSPSWSPDLAGWTLIISIILGIVFILSLIIKRFVN